MNKKIVLIVVPITLIVIVSVILSVLYFTTDAFKATDELFWKYFAQNSNILDLTKNDKFVAQTDFKKANSYISNGELNLTSQEGENSSKQLNAITTARHDTNSGRTYADAILKNGDIDLFKVSYINSGDIYAVKCDDIFANYVGIQNSNLKDLASKYGIINIDNIPDTININDYTSIMENTEEQNTHIIETYLPIIQNNIPKDQFAKTNQNIQINGNTYNSNVYAVRITGQNLKRILIDVLSNLKNDTATLVLLSNKFSSLNMGIEYTDITNLALNIGKLVENIQNQEFQSNIDIYVYEQDGKTIRTEIKTSDNTQIIYEQIPALKKLTFNFSTPQNIISNESPTVQESNEIIDLDASIVQEANQSNPKSQIILTKNTSQNYTESILTIIPDTNKPEEDLTVSVNMSSIQNNSINNVYNFAYNYIEDGKAKSLSIDYNVNTTKAEQIEEIMELNGSNTAIANNYNAEQFSKFISEWAKLFVVKLEEKLKTIGFDIVDIQNNY